MSNNISVESSEIPHIYVEVTDLNKKIDLQIATSLNDIITNHNSNQRSHVYLSERIEQTSNDFQTKVDSLEKIVQQCKDEAVELDEKVNTFSLGNTEKQFYVAEPIELYHAVNKGYLEQNYADKDLSNLSLNGKARFDDKANTDLNNITEEGKNLISSLVTPSPSVGIPLTLGVSSSKYTAPASGFVVFAKFATAVDQHVQLYMNVDGYSIVNRAVSIANPVYVVMQVAKGDSFYAAYSALGATHIFRFVYAKGAQ